MLPERGTLRSWARQRAHRCAPVILRVQGRADGQIFWEGFGEDLSLSLLSPCQKNPQQKIRVKIRTEIPTQKNPKSHEHPHTNPRKNPHKTSAHKNPHTKIRTQKFARHRDPQRNFPPDLPQRKTWPLPSVRTWDGHRNKLKYSFPGPQTRAFDIYWCAITLPARIITRISFCFRCRISN